MYCFFFYCIINMVIYNMDNNILRENDIRGSYPEQINSSIAKKIGKAFGTYALSKNIVKCVVGHDNRLSGSELHDALVEGLLSTGVNIVDIGLSTTALFNFSSRELEIPYGVIVTASHNPSGDNGFKVFGENFLHLEQSELEKFYNILKDENFSVGSGKSESKNLIKQYAEMMIYKSKITKRLKVVLDCGNGTTSILVKDIFDNLPIDVTYLHCESDGSFPVHNPDPNEEKNLTWLSDKVRTLKADVGIAFDGDGDRVGVVDENGKMIATDILMAIYAGEIIPKSTNKKIIIDVKCSKALEQEIVRLGGEAIMLKNGSAYIETMVFKTPTLLGGEYSGHVFFRDDFDGYDDGIYAGIRLLNILSKTEKKCSHLHMHMNHYYNTPEIRVDVDDNLKSGIVDKIKDYALSNYSNVNLVDGVRVEFDDGFSLIRISNTSPCITLRFEAGSREVLEMRKREFINLLNYHLK